LRQGRIRSYDATRVRTGALPPGAAAGARGSPRRLPRPILDFKLSYLAVYGRRESTLNYDFDGDGRLDILNLSINNDVSPPERWVALTCSAAASTPSRRRRCGRSRRRVRPRHRRLPPGGGTEVGFLAPDGVYVYPWANNRPAEKPIKLIHVRTFFQTPSMKQCRCGSGRWTCRATASTTSSFRCRTAIASTSRRRRASSEDGDARIGPAGDLDAVARGDVLRRRSRDLAVPVRLLLRAPRLEIVDINGDGLSDLVLIRKEMITYYLQKERGVFPSSRPSRVSYEIPTLRTEAKKDSVNLAIIRFVDINADKLADLVVTKIEGSSASSRASRRASTSTSARGRGTSWPTSGS
jgi:hypothetical protein